MYVRVFDKQHNTYFKSEVYAVINSGWYEKRLVVVSSDCGSYFKLFDYIDKSDPKKPIVLINSITTNGFSPDYEWAYHSSNDLDKNLAEYAALSDDNIYFFEFRGYSWIYQDNSLLSELLKGGMVSVKKYENQIIASKFYQLEGWNYIEKQQDINFLFEQTHRFHDSILKDLNYVSGGYVNDKNQMHCTDSIRQVTMRFDSQWCDSIEMIFEGVTTLNLRPHTDNESSYLYDASLFIQDETVFFFDSHIDGIDKSYDGTWIGAYWLRWRLMVR